MLNGYNKSKIRPLMSFANKRYSNIQRLLESPMQALINVTASSMKMLEHSIKRWRGFLITTITAVPMQVSY
ncbi:hypothetical protein DC094_18040 [Pelagibaculum spongiae]|uniref:Uncharacterized protein n=1 Tax=Pelagibaculum spongiae TaxID=2080658 RepID=A0A2V1GPQ5_9GAMM|nr:hypothetical protein DC094_18040 [Pelagibaculum spongiae]